MKIKKSVKVVLICLFVVFLILMNTTVNATRNERNKGKLRERNINSNFNQKNKIDNISGQDLKKRNLITKCYEFYKNKYQRACSKGWDKDIFLNLSAFKEKFCSVINNAKNPSSIIAAIRSYFKSKHNEENEEITLLYEPFNNLNNWRGDIGPGKWRNYYYGGAYSLVLDSDNLAGDNNVYSKNYSTIGYSLINITFDYKPNNLDPDDARFYMYSVSGYIEIEDFSNGVQSSWNTFNWKSNDPQFMHNTFHLRFREKSSSAIENVLIDNLYIKVKT